MAKYMHTCIVLVAAFLLASGADISERQYGSSGFEDPFADLPPEAIGYICNTLCQSDGGSDADLLNAMTAMQQELDEIKASLTSVSELLTEAELTPVREEWKKKYPVYMVASPSGHYELTKDGAHRLCEDSGGHLANFNQLLAAFNAGLDWCSCGWLTEGYAAYPIQFPRVGCNVEVGPGIRSCHWQNLWNAWCIQGDYYT